MYGMAAVTRHWIKMVKNNNIFYKLNNIMDRTFTMKKKPVSFEEECPGSKNTYATKIQIVVNMKILGLANAKN